LSPTAAAPGPLDDYYYAPLGQVASAGVRVDADAALKHSVVWACVDLLASVVGMLPLHIYKTLPDGGKVRATNHPLYPRLRAQPNSWQTASEFRSQMTAHVLLRGNAYAQIVPGPSGFADQLIPLSPDRMQVFQDSTDRTLKYLYQPAQGAKIAYDQDQIHHLRGLGTDGLTGLSVIQHARESIGFGLAAEQYGNRFFSQASNPGGVLKHPGKLSKDGAARLRKEWQEAHAGLGNAHQVAVLEEGMDFKALTILPADAMLIQSREFSIEDISRWFRVPLHMINSVSKVTSWGTGIEAQSIGFSTYTLMRWLTMWTQAISRDLILAKSIYFAGFEVRQLLQGDSPARAAYYASGRQWGWLSVNDIHEMEGLDPIGDEGDIYLQPVNMVDSEPPIPEAPADVAPDEQTTAIAGPPALNAESEQLHRLTHDAAARLVHKEIAAMSKAARRAASDEFAWQAAIEDFYGPHRATVRDTLHVSDDAAAWYCNDQEGALSAAGAGAARHHVCRQALLRGAVTLRAGELLHEVDVVARLGGGRLLPVRAIECGAVLTPVVGGDRLRVVAVELLQVVAQVGRHAHHRLHGVGRVDAVLLWPCPA